MIKIAKYQKKKILTHTIFYYFATLALIEKNIRFTVNYIRLIRKIIIQIKLIISWFFIFIVVFFFRVVLTIIHRGYHHLKFVLLCANEISGNHLKNK